MPVEDYSLITSCAVKYEDLHYSLSFTTPPGVLLTKAWAVLVSSPSSFFDEVDPVDFDIGEEGILFDKEWPSTKKYYKAQIMVEGKMVEDAEDKNWIDGKEVFITHPNPLIEEDIYEPDNDAGILFDSNHKIIINAQPEIHTFYCPNAPLTCSDVDWVYFYAVKDHTYEICAQDLSINGYFIKLNLYPEVNLTCDANISVPCYEDTDYLSFTCPENGYYLCKAQLASSYPPEGVEYILSVSDPHAGRIDSLLVMLLNASQMYYIRGEIDDNYIFPNAYRIEYADNRLLFKFNDLTPGKTMQIEVYQSNDFSGAPLGIAAVRLLPYSLNLVKIELGSIGPNIIILPEEDSLYTEYTEKIIGYKDEWGDPNKVDPDQNVLIEVYWYFPQLHEWKPSSEEVPNSVIINSNKFNALETTGGGMLYLDLTERNHPVLHLRGFDQLDTDLFDPNYFDSNRSTREIINNLLPGKIEMIHGQSFKKGDWGATYGFFGKTAGADIRLKPYELYVVTKKRGSAP